jgi:hypothetical protein
MESGYFGDIWMAAYINREGMEAALKHCTPTVYTVDSASFAENINPSNGRPTGEWVSSEAVKPINREAVTMEDVLKDGTQVFFIDHPNVTKYVWYKVKREHGQFEPGEGPLNYYAALHREGLIVHENERLNIKPVNLEEYYKPGRYDEAVKVLKAEIEKERLPSKDFLKRITADHTQGTNWTLDILTRNPERQALLETAMVIHGINDLNPKRLGGNMAVVVEAGDREVLRISDAKIEGVRLQEDEVWAPSKDYGVVAGFRVEKFPKTQPMDKAIAVGDLSKKEAFEMIEDLAVRLGRKNQFLWDCKPDNFNVTKTREGKYVAFVIDSGAIAPLAQMHAGKIGNDTHTNLDKFVANLSYLAREAGVSDAAIQENPEAYFRKMIGTRTLEDVDRKAIQRQYQEALNVKEPLLLEASPPSKQPLEKNTTAVVRV